MKIEINAEQYLSIDEDLVLKHSTWLDTNGHQSDSPNVEESTRLEDVLYDWFEANVVPTDPPYLPEEERKQAKRMAKKLRLLADQVGATIKLYTRKKA